MKIGILCAGDTEAATFYPMMEGASTREKALLRVQEGVISNCLVTLVFSGVCKVNAAIAARVLIDSFGCGAIINAGATGGMAAQVGFLDLVAGTQAAHHDVTANILTEFHPGWIPSGSVQTKTLYASCGRLRSISRRPGCTFRVHDHGQTVCHRRVNAALAPLNADIETAAVAHVCHANAVPFLAMRVITDTADHCGVGAFEENCARASGLSANWCAGCLRSWQPLFPRKRPLRIGRGS